MKNKSRARLVLFFCGAALFLLLALVALLQTPPAKRLILAQAARYLHSHAGIEFEAGRFDYSLLRLTLELRECALRSSVNPQTPFLTAQQVYFSLSLADLLRGSMPIHDARLNGVAVRILVNADGQTNLPKPPVRKPAPTNILVPPMRLTDGSFIYEDLQRGLAVNLPRWNLAVEVRSSPDEPRDIRFDTVEEGSLALSGRESRISGVHLAAGLTGAHTRIRELAIDADLARAKVSGEIALPDGLLNLDVEGVWQLARLESLLELPAGLRGELAVHGQITGEAAAPDIRGEVAGAGLSAFGYPDVAVTVHPHWSSNTGVLDFESLKLRSGRGSVAGSARFVPSGSEPSWIRATLTDWDARPLSARMDLPVLVASRASGTLQGEWTGTDMTEARGEAAIQLAPEASRISGKLVPLTAALQLSYARGRTEVRVSSASAPGLRLRGQVSLLNNEKLAGAANLDMLDLGAVGEDLRNILSNKYSFLSTPLGGSIDLAARIDGTLKQPDFQLELVGRQIHVGSIQDISLVASLDADSTRMVLRDARATWANTTLSTRGSLSFTQSPPALALGARIENASLADILTALGSPAPVTGIIDVQADVAGPLSQLEARAELRVFELEACGERLGDLQAGLGLAGQRLELKRLSLDRKEGAAGGREIFAASGYYDLESKSFELRSEGRSVELHTLTLPGGLPVRTTLSLTATGSGTLAVPDVTAALDLRDFRLGETLVGLVHGRVRLRDRLAELELEAPDLAVSASGSLSLQFPYQAEIAVEGKGTELGRLGLSLAPDIPLRGAFSGTITASGDLGEWRNAKAAAEINQLLLTVRNRTIANQGAIRLGLAGGTLTLEQLALLSGSSHISVDGAVPLLDPKLPGSLNIAGRIDLPAVMDFLPAGEGLSVAGGVDVVVRLKGNRNDIRLAGSAKMQGGSFLTTSLPVPLTQMDADVRIQDGVLRLASAQGKLADGTLRINGQVPLGLLLDKLPVRFEAAPGPAHLVMELIDLPVGSLPHVPSGLTGTIGLRVDAAAARPDVEALKAEVRFEKLNLRFDQYQVAQPGPSVIAIEGGVARIQQFALTGPGTQLQATGAVGLIPDSVLAVQIRGQMEAGLLTFFSRDLRAGGNVRVQIDVGNRLSDPRFSGFLESQNARLALQTPRLQAEDLNFRINLDGDRMAIERFTATLNGGPLKAGGGLQLAGARIAGVDIQADARDVALDFPAGLRTVLDADLTIRSRDDLIVIGGAAHVLEGAYREPLDLEGEVLRFLRSDQSINLSAEPNPFLSRIRYGAQLDTQGPVLVDNNIAKLALDAKLEVTGTYYRPVVTGRMTLEEGGEIYLGERKYAIDRGIIDLQNPLRIEPTLDVVAKAEVSSYDITLQISGTPEELTSSLTSDPELPEPDIVSLLITGRTLGDVQGAQLNVAKEQVLSYLVGRVGGAISREAEQTLGLSRVRVEPNLISPESDPGARLTIGENITPKLQLIYSMDLANSQDQIWIADYKPVARFDTRAIRQSDNSYRFDFRHDLRFGSTGTAALSARPRTELKIGRIEFLGNPLYPESQLSRKFRLDSGDRYDFFKVRKGTDNLEQYFQSQGHLEAQVRLDRQKQDHTMDLAFHIAPGPKVVLQYEGLSPSSDLQQRVRKAWETAVFDQQRAEEAMRAIREALVRDGHLLPRVSYVIEEPPAGGKKRVIFRIDPGAQYHSVSLVFDGAAALKPSELKDRLGAAGRELDVYLATDRVSDFLARVYRDEGYLDARVSPASYELNPDTGSGRVTIRIDEGPRFVFGKSEFTGNSAYSGSELDKVISPFGGRPYGPKALSDAMAKLQDHYWRHGFNNVAINYALQKRQDEPVLNVGFEIAEDKQEIIEGITIKGNKRSSPDFVRSRLTFSLNDPLDYVKINQSRKRLYDTGAYAVVDLKTVETKTASGAGATRPVKIQVDLREVKPYRLNYGGFYDTDRGPGGIVEFTRQNFLGAARQLGFQGRYDGDIHEIRGYFGQPFLRYYPLRTSATIFLRREINPTFFSDRTGFSLQQETQLRDHFILSYGYRFERTHTYDRVPDPIFPFDVTLPVGRLSSSLMRDTRDDLLNASRGSFASHTFEYAPKTLGSDIRFFRYFGQYFRYVPLSRPTEAPLSKGLRKSRLVFAGAVRLGLAKGLGGQVVVPSERFFAGGGTTVRGFGQDTLGPVDFEGNPVGGDAMFVVNNEIRFPMISIFDGVAFLDLGNVYRTLSDFDPFRVRKSAGFGLRVRTPFLLLRLDYGFKLDRRPGEILGKFFFSVGQAF